MPGKCHNLPQAEKIKRLTDNGDEFKMLNGVTDWANEEENIKADNTIYWSPDGKKLLFASYDVEQVDLLRYSTFDTKNGYQEFSKLEDAYPTIREIPYAKAGGNYAEVILTVVDDFDNSEAGEYIPLPAGSFDMAHLSRTSWSPDSEWFVMSWINRDTTTRRTYGCKKVNGDWTVEELGFESSTDHWVGFKGPFYPLATETYGKYLTILSTQDENDSYWRVVTASKRGDVQLLESWPHTGTENKNKYVVSDISVNKVLSVNNNYIPLYTYAAPLPSQDREQSFFYVRVLIYIYFWLKSPTSATSLFFSRWRGCLHHMRSNGSRPPDRR